MGFTKQGKQDGFIYVLDIGVDGLYKIGCTRNLKRRITSLNAANPRIRKVVAYKVLRMKVTEKFLHQQFASLHHSKELFKLGKVNIDWIRSYLKEENTKFLRLEDGKCPKCAGKMVLRTNTKNGNNFYGCVNFPECKTAIPINRIENIKGVKA